jgi:hypothetical protein
MASTELTEAEQQALATWLITESRTTPSLVTCNANAFRKEYPGIAPAQELDKELVRKGVIVWLQKKIHRWKLCQMKRKRKSCSARKENP